jgi:hypothetical protein
MNYSGVYGVGQIIHDPDREGGFPAGARLNGIYPSLRLGIFTPGSILLIQGKRMRVHGKVGEPQKLVYAPKD